jgi:FkbM family methyltransferase
MKNFINRYLKKLGLELHGTGYLQSLAKGDFKNDAFAIQKKIIGSRVQPVVFDIGANRGDTVEKYLGDLNNAKIYAFEPFPETFESLKHRFSENQAVLCFPFAVSNSEEPKVFYVNKNIDTNSLLKPKKSGLSSDKEVANKSEITVQTITLDKFCADHKIEHIDILKMDIQGGELQALQGAVNLLQKNKIGLIYSETFFINQYELQPLFHDLSKFLQPFGYYLQDIYSPVYGKGSLAWADVN